MTARERAEELMRKSAPRADAGPTTSEIEAAILAAEADAYERAAKVADTEAIEARRLLRRLRPSLEAEACAKAAAAIATARDISASIRSLSTKGGDRG